jgi:Tfp pilus assembly protein PilF
MRARYVLIIFVVLFPLIASVQGQEYTANYWLQKGNEFLGNNSYELAEKCIDKAIELDPGYELAWK